MHASPDREIQNAALADGPVTQIDSLPCTANNKPEADKLRRLYCSCHATACTIASLAFAVSR
jgi:hypothetical protein